ncbi:MAG: EF-hand domain-containing protein, partial [Patescibacteria group bacterium]|nr:EF-hand domain-containing protein [Patescibacteria group bacterium]
MSPLHLLGLSAVLGAALAAGCSGVPSPPKKPAFNASAAGKAAIEIYDKDGNGKLDAQELASSPALQLALPRMDTDGDGALSADEIAARVAQWFASGTTMMDA